MNNDCMFKNCFFRNNLKDYLYFCNMLKRKTIERTKKRFGSQVRAYDKYRSIPPEKAYKLLFSLIKKEGVIDVLDVGCGTGKSTEPLVRKNIKVVGCDHDVKMLDQAKKNALSRNLDITYKKCEVENLPFKPNSFDIVVCFNAFHWFANRKTVKNIKRVLRPGGFLFIFWKQIGKEDVFLRKKIFSHFGLHRKYSSKFNII